MNIFKWFVSGSEAAGKVLDGAVKGIDALVYTEEERAVMKQKLGDQWLELQKALGEETTVRSVTRRILAVLIVVPFVFLILFAAFVYKFDMEYAKFLLALAESQFGWLVLGVAGFYFGPYMMNRGK
jgi:hypothetical protein